MERDPDYVFQPSYLWLMTGLRTREKISRPLSRLDPKSIERICGTVERIDPERKTVTVDGRELAGDYLVIALGAELAPESVPGLAQAGHDLYILSGAESLREARLGLRAGRLALLVCGIPFKCPAAPLPAKASQGCSTGMVNVSWKPVMARPASAAATSMPNRHPG